MHPAIHHLLRARDRFAVSLTAFPFPFRYVLCIITLFGVLFVNLVLSFKMGLGEYSDWVGGITIFVCGGLSATAITRSKELDLEFAAKMAREEEVSDEDIISIEDDK